MHEHFKQESFIQKPELSKKQKREELKHTEKQERLEIERQYIDTIKQLLQAANLSDVEIIVEDGTDHSASAGRDIRYGYFQYKGRRIFNLFKQVGPIWHEEEFKPWESYYIPNEEVQIFIVAELEMHPLRAQFKDRIQCIDERLEVLRDKDVTESELVFKACLENDSIENRLDSFEIEATVDSMGSLYFTFDGTLYPVPLTEEGILQLDRVVTAMEGKQASMVDNRKEYLPHVEEIIKKIDDDWFLVDLSDYHTLSLNGEKFDWNSEGVQKFEEAIDKAHIKNEDIKQQIMSRVEQGMDIKRSTGFSNGYRKGQPWQYTSVSYHLGDIKLPEHTVKYVEALVEERRKGDLVNTELKSDVEVLITGNDSRTKSYTLFQKKGKPLSWIRDLNAMAPHLSANRMKRPGYTLYIGQEHFKFRDGAEIMAYLEQRWPQLWKKNVSKE